VRRILILAVDGCQLLDVAGPMDVFDGAARLVPGAYRVRVATPGGGGVRASNGLRLGADVAVERARGPLDTLVVAGGPTVGRLAGEPLLAGHLRRLAAESRRVASVCSGAELLAGAGLLDGRRVTTHWAACDLFAKMFPTVRLERDPIYVRDGNVWSSAGVTAGMDLALALVEEDLGRDVALETARGLVLFLRRPGGQSQFSAQLAVQAADRQPLRELCAWIVDHPNEDLAVDRLARRVAMSPRHFARVFGREMGMTPARYVEQVRVEAARRRLEESANGVDAIADACGFGTAETMRRAFLRIVRVPPSAYRGRFRSALGRDDRRRSA